MTLARGVRTRNLWVLWLGQSLGFFLMMTSEETTAAAGGFVYIVSTIAIYLGLKNALRLRGKPRWPAGLLLSLGLLWPIVWLVWLRVSSTKTGVRTN